MPAAVWADAVPERRYGVWRARHSDRWTSAACRPYGSWTDWSSGFAGVEYAAERRVAERPPPPPPGRPVARPSAIPRVRPTGRSYRPVARPAARIGMANGAARRA